MKVVSIIPSAYSFYKACRFIHRCDREFYMNVIALVSYLFSCRLFGLPVVNEMLPASMCIHARVHMCISRLCTTTVAILFVKAF